MDTILFSDTVGGIMVERIKREASFNMVSKHFHNEYEIYYLVSGERFYFIEKQTYDVKKGSLVIIDRNQIHKTVGTNTTHHDRILMLITEEALEPIFQLYDNIDMRSFFTKNSGVIELNEAGQHYVEELLFGIIREMKEKHTSYEFVTKAKLAELLIFATRCKNGENATLKSETIQTEKYKKINEIAEYITQNYQYNISLADISEDFYISKCYLSRIFKEITGFTVNEYINIIRIKKAQQLLENTDYSITQIAGLVGYDSITYFEKVFKKYTEISPLKYRKKLMKLKQIG
ncbi:AraC family transcriptional regulator [Mobilitalea sibirica]|uniref:AraC family transcriptional regulator n=1 Tax=Mobilitalea sibirica TaxID=1462919 RepID=A0A8J7HBZ2_9FIRM|nr:AraC family transcriptional regulator [Mobilitalea sibirica]MBH1940507.1 AraC family transcriptional regulator [Mobilitalea sibirica]